jgi:predicted transcriptional regulator
MTRQKTSFPQGLVAKGLGMAIGTTERALGALRATYRSLTGKEAPVHALLAVQGRLPAVPIEMSVTPDYIVCLEDGKRFKMLKGHLRASYGMSPAEYREEWGLPADYPMVAPKYREKRVRMAQDMGLGHMRKAKAGKTDSKKAA